MLKKADLLQYISDIICLLLKHELKGFYYLHI